MTYENTASLNADDRLATKKIRGEHFPPPGRAWFQTQPPSDAHPHGLWASREWTEGEQAAYTAEVLGVGR